MIQLAPERWFNYILVQCADEYRDEHLNVGVLVYDPLSQELAPKFEPDLERVERVLPHVKVAHLRMLMNSTSASARRHVDDEAVQQLAAAHMEWRNLLRASTLRSILGRDLETVATDLFNRYVRVHSRSGAPMLPAISTPASQFSSALVVRSLRARLNRHGLAKGDGYQENAQLTGFTRNHVPVPVWYPLQVKQTTYMDGLQIHEDPARDYDLARLAAQKVEQTLRSMPESRIALAIRDPGASSLGEKVESIIYGDGQVGGAGPVIFRYSDTNDLDGWMAELFRQPSLL